MTLARDAALAGVVLAAVVVAAAVTATPVAPAAAAVGAVAALAVELLMSRRAAAVQRLWRRTGVRVLGVALALAAVAAAAALAPAVGLNALAGGLVAYLVLVGLVAGGVIPPTTAWRAD